MQKEKRYRITETRESAYGERVSTFEGTVPELTEIFSYTLMCGKSYERERGARKVNTRPATASSLIAAIRNASDNRAANGCGGACYSIEKI